MNILLDNTAISGACRALNPYRKRDGYKLKKNYLDFLDLVQVTQALLFHEKLCLDGSSKKTDYEKESWKREIHELHDLVGSWDEFKIIVEEDFGDDIVEETYQEYLALSVKNAEDNAGNLIEDYLEILEKTKLEDLLPHYYQKEDTPDSALFDTLEIKNQLETVRIKGKKPNSKQMIMIRKLVRHYFRGIFYYSLGMVHNKIYCPNPLRGKLLISNPFDLKFHVWEGIERHLNINPRREFPSNKAFKQLNTTMNDWNYVSYTDEALDVPVGLPFVLNYCFENNCPYSQAIIEIREMNEVKKFQSEYSNIIDLIRKPIFNKEDFKSLKKVTKKISDLFTRSGYASGRYERKMDLSSPVKATTKLFFFFIGKDIGKSLDNIKLELNIKVPAWIYNKFFRKGSMIFLFDLFKFGHGVRDKGIERLLDEYHRKFHIHI